MSSQLNNLTVPELKNLARQRGLRGFSRLLKSELISLLQFPTLDIAELLTYCATNKQYCGEEFWQYLVQQKYGNVTQINNSWQQTYIYSYQYDTMQPYVDVFGSLEAFLDVMIPILISYMSVNPYRFNYEAFAANLAQIVENIVKLAQVENGELLNQLKDPHTLHQFMNSSIPGLYYPTVINPYDVNTDERILAGIPGINILDTGELFETKIDKYYVSMLDLLQATMSVKTFKEDFTHEVVVGIESFDPEEQVITLQIIFAPF